MESLPFPNCSRILCLSLYGVVIYHFGIIQTRSNPLQSVKIGLGLPIWPLPRVPLKKATTDNPDPLPRVPTKSHQKSGFGEFVLGSQCHKCNFFKKSEGQKKSNQRFFLDHLLSKIIFQCIPLLICDPNHLSCVLVGNVWKSSFHRGERQTHSGLLIAWS